MKENTKIITNESLHLTTTIYMLHMQHAKGITAKQTQIGLWLNLTSRSKEIDFVLKTKLNKYTI